MKDSRCNFCKNCDVRCRYDDVYLSENDEKRIVGLVNDNKEYFQFLPDDYIITSNWNIQPQEEKQILNQINIKKTFPGILIQLSAFFQKINNVC